MCPHERGSSRRVLDDFYHHCCLSLCFVLSRLTESVQVFQHKRAVYGDASQRRTSVHLPAVSAGSKVLFPDAVMYGTELVVERRFCAVCAASGAVDHFRRDRYHVELCPKRGGFLRRALSFVIVAILASHFSQSSPQQPIS